MRFFPSPECRNAFERGKDHVIGGGLPGDAHQAMSFCETRQEEVFFLMGCAEESRDLEDIEELAA